MPTRGAEHEEAQAPRPPPPTEEARDGDPYWTCDVHETSCQEQVLAMVAEERGEPAPPLPKIEFAPKPPPKPPQSDDDTADAFDAPVLIDWPWDAALGALQVLPVGWTWNRALGEELAGRDNYAAQQVNLFEVTDTSAAARRGAMAVLAHELTHYMQDRRQLGAFAQTRDAVSIDAAAAHKALIEGEATVVGWRVSARIAGEPFDWQRAFDADLEQTLKLVEAARAPLTAAVTEMPYAIGGRFIAQLWDAHGRQAVDALLQAPPTTIADWLNASTLGMTGPSVIEAVGCAAPPADPRYPFKARTSLGVLGALAVLAAASATDLDLASKLRGDSLSVYDVRNPDVVLFGPAIPRVLVGWQMLFVDEGAAVEFAQAIEPLGFGLERTGRQLLVKASGNPTFDPPELIAPSACN